MLSWFVVFMCLFLAYKVVVRFATTCSTKCLNGTVAFWGMGKLDSPNIFFWSEANVIVHKRLMPACASCLTLGSALNESFLKRVFDFLRRQSRNVWSFFNVFLFFICPPYHWFSADFASLMGASFGPLPLYSVVGDDHSAWFSMEFLIPSGTI